LGFLYDWFEERFQVQSIGDDILSKFVPAHVNIFYCFGGIVLTCFLVQAATGFGLTLFYRPTVLEAYTSVQFIVTDVNLGWLVRSMHRWSSGLMFLCLLLHVSRVYLTGGFKKPRELTWVSGVLLSLATLTFGVTGYSLPWDQVGYWACKIVTAVPESLDALVPGIGSLLVLFLRCGYSVGQLTLTRLYSAHTFILPLLTIGLLLLHFAILRKQGISGPL
jgi:cytochrome b6